MKEELIWTIIMGLIGSCMGSFLYLFQARLIVPYPPYYRSLKLLYQPRSHCSLCHKPLLIWQLIPIVSWLLLRGRCAFCQKHIGINSLLTELSFAVIFMLSEWHFNHHQSMTFILLSIWFYILACYDIKYYLLPDIFVAPFYAIGLIFCIMGYTDNSLIQAFINCLITFIAIGMIAAIFYYYKNHSGIGFGDIKLITGLGCWFQLDKIPIIMIIACSTGLLWLLIFNQTKPKKMKKIAFGPFILFGAWVVLIYN
ncbi:prepilin peptidase [Utexia brackfieldae]|uniref:prepilin peptidase n=1 Tax=Utexia brackfieldae TaxID=3074108 RepID=UPI00370D07A7